MDLTGFYATVSGVGFTLLGLWWVVVDKHPEWFRRRDTSVMAYVLTLQFVIPATSSLLSLAAPQSSTVWRTVFGLLGLVGMAGALLVAGTLRDRGRVASLVTLVAGLPVYAGVVLVAAVPTIGRPLDLTGLQVEAFLTALVLVLALHAVWFFSHADLPTD